MAASSARARAQQPFQILTLPRLKITPQFQNLEVFEHEPQSFRKLLFQGILRNGGFFAAKQGSAAPLPPDYISTTQGMKFASPTVVPLRPQYPERHQNRPARTSHLCRDPFNSADVALLPGDSGWRLLIQGRAHTRALWLLAASSGNWADQNSGASSRASGRRSVRGFE